VRFRAVVIIDNVTCPADVFLHVKLFHGCYLSAGTPAGCYDLFGQVISD
jgi:hypothetical protein